MIEYFMHNIWVASWCSTFFICFLMIGKNTFIQYLGARWSYYLWFIIFIPYITVWLPELFPNGFIDIKNILPNDPLLISQKILANVPHSQISLYLLGLICWLGIAICCATYVLFKYFHFISILKANSEPLTISQQNNLTKLLGINLISLDKIYLSNIISSPLICHVINSKIYLPHNFLQHYTLEEQNYLLLHECTHYQRCDLIVNTLMFIFICLNWYNPIILLSYRYFRQMQEFSCDFMVCQQLTTTQKKAYGYTLLKTITPSYEHSMMTCGWNTGKLLKERCIMLKYHHSKPMKNLLGVLVLSTVTSLAVAAPKVTTHYNSSRDLKISNFTNDILAFSIRHVCFTHIAAHSVHVIPYKQLFHVCKNNTSNCEIKTHATPNCKDKAFATLTIDLTGWGIMSILPYEDTYHIGANGFNLFFQNIRFQHSLERL